MSNQLQQQSLFNQSPLVHKADWLPKSDQSCLVVAAGEQEKRIVAYLGTVEKATPGQIHKAIGKPNEPLTSIRRAITNLTKAGILVMMDETTKGDYGVSVHYWRMAK